MMKKQNTLSRWTGLALVAALFFAMIPGNDAHAQAEQPSEQQIAIHYSLYWEDFRNENFERALPNLHWILKNAPGFPQDNDRNFRRLIEAFEKMAATDPAYVDSALATYNRAVPALKAANIEVDEMDWLINKGRFIQTFGEQIPNAQAEAAEVYMEAYRMSPETIDAYYVNFIIADMNSRGDREATLEFMEEAEQHHGDDMEVVDYIAQVRNSLFRNPGERIEFLESQLERRPDDVDLIGELFDLYLREGERQKAVVLSERLLSARPTARSYEMIARMNLEDGKPQAAFDLYQQALEMEGADERRRDIFFNMGIAQQQMGRLSNARTYFRRALEVDSRFGAALMAIGDLYVTQVGNCGSFDRDDRAVYWLAVDYYERAAAADPAIANQARQKARSYVNSFPTMEDIFFKGWSVGQTHRINYGCYSWINETTTVRRP
jgi:tetratricopeptide (TPR) repeat protein